MKLTVTNISMERRFFMTIQQDINETTHNKLRLK